MEAFNCLYQRHRAPLYRYLLRMCRDEILANDLYQGTWEKILKAASSYRTTTPFKPWMYVIARNHLADHFRRHRVTEEWQDERAVSEDAGPEDQMQRDQKSLQLTAAVERLPREQREALMLKLEAGMSVETIAQITGVNAETAKSRLRYAVKKLQNQLNEARFE